MISFPSRATLTDVEQFLRDIRQAPGQDIRLPLHILRGGPFGFSAVAIQALATWARLHDGVKILKLPPPYGTDENARERFSGTTFGMSALYFADQVECNQVVFKKPRSLELVGPRVRAMDEYRYRDTARGRAAALCCFEGARLEFLQSLYAIPQRGTSEITTVRSNSEFGEIFDALLEASSSTAARKLENSARETLGALIHQLFKNADVHTVTDATGKAYESGVRGIEVREVSVSDEKAFSDFSADDAPFRAYLTKLSTRQVVREDAKGSKKAELSERSGATFIEVTLFDTGPGMALRWLAKKVGATKYSDFSRDEELSAVKECFQLHATTHSTVMRGDGLEIALRSLKNLKAFLFLRTGRLALYQDFSTQDHRGFVPRHRYGSKRAMSEVVGSTYSICFPLLK